MEYWDHSCSIWLKNNTAHGINKPWIEKTSKEDKKTPSPAYGPQGLRPGGQDDVSLYVLACKIFANFPFELKIMLRPATHIRYHIYGHPCCALSPIRSSIQKVDQTIGIGVLEYWNGARR